MEDKGCGMYARLTSGRLRPSRAEEATRIWNDELPRYRAVAGFVGGYLLIDPATNGMLSLTLWESAQYSRAHVESGAMSRVLSRFLELLEDEPNIRGSEVAASI
jgi:heme-degrading monooxygenase HmoA